MNAWAVEHGPLDFIVALGDNFYPAGITGVLDPLWKTCWEDMFLTHGTLRVPWHAVLGNHDYMGSPEAEVSLRGSHSGSLHVVALWRIFVLILLLVDYVDCVHILTAQSWRYMALPVSKLSPAL